MKQKTYQAPQMEVLKVQAQQMVCASDLESAGFTVEGTTIQQDYNDPTHGWGSDLDW